MDWIVLVLTGAVGLLICWKWRAIALYLAEFKRMMRDIDDDLNR